MNFKLKNISACEFILFRYLCGKEAIIMHIIYALLSQLAAKLENLSYNIIMPGIQVVSCTHCKSHPLKNTVRGACPRSFSSQATNDKSCAEAWERG